MLTESLPAHHVWWRIADPAWHSPVDPTHAARVGGRWNPPDSWPTLYLNEDVVTARLNVQRFTAAWPYEPEDLRPEHAPLLVGLTLPRSQRVADIHTPDGVDAAGLPATYPRDQDGNLVGHKVCQTVGHTVHIAGLRGIRCRSASSPLGEGRELAWFPASARSQPTVTQTRTFIHWYWT